MKKILLVEDDVLVRKLYSESLARDGFDVATAEDGIAGITALSCFKPDLVVLDLLMPRLTGEEVLRHMRSRQEYKDIPVIVFSNTYLSSLTRDAVALGVDRAVLKTSCTAPMLADMVNEVLSERESATTHASHRESGSHVNANSEAAFRGEARRHFLTESGSMLSVMLASHQSFLETFGEEQQTEGLKALLASFHLIEGAAGPAGSRAISQLAMVMEALLFQLSHNPSRLTHSVRRTIAAAVDCMTMLFKQAVEEADSARGTPPALVVDDDPVANRVIAASLKEAGVHPDCTSNPFEGMQMLMSQRYGLIVLDIRMPGLDGIEFCRRLRTVEGYEKVPVIFVTAQSDFDTRAKGILSGANDMIAKPIFPTELAAKAIIHVLSHS